MQSEQSHPEVDQAQHQYSATQYSSKDNNKSSSKPIRPKSHEPKNPKDNKQQPHDDEIEKNRESLLRELKQEINQIKNNNNSGILFRNSRSIRIRRHRSLAARDRNKSSMTDAAEPNNFEIPYNNNRDLRNNEKVWDDATGSLREMNVINTNNVDSSRNLLKKSTGKVMNVAKMPFRSVKRRFTSQPNTYNESSIVTPGGQVQQTEYDDGQDRTVLRRTIRVDAAPESSSLVSSLANNHDNASHLGQSNADPNSLFSERSNHDSHSINSQSTLAIRNLNSRKDAQLCDNNNNAAGTVDSLLDKEEVYVLKQVERILRLVCLMFACYYLGVHYPSYLQNFSRIGEYALVAWATCISIQFLTFMKLHCSKRSHPHLQQQQQLAEMRVSVKNNSSSGASDPIYTAHLSTDDENDCGEFHDDYSDFPVTTTNWNINDPGYPGLLSRDISFDSADDEGAPVLPSLEVNALNSPSSTGSAPSNSDTESLSTKLEVGNESDPKHLVSDSQHSASRKKPQPICHPSLDPFYVIDKSNNERIYPNQRNAYKLDTEYFKGEMMILIRTPNVDRGYSGNPPDLVAGDDAGIVKFFSGKLRRFEFQFQVKLKRVPVGRVYFACELENEAKMGVIQRAFVGAAMAFVKSTNKSFHYSLSGTPSESNDDQRYEAPHMAFPVEEGMNRVVATPPGQNPPPLGTEIFEDPDSIKRRKKGIRLQYNTADTYTFSLWSQYVDFLDWRCLNLPGIRPFSITSVIGPQPVILTLYEICDSNSMTGKPLEKHYKSEMIKIVTLEMCNSVHASLGPATKHWQRNQLRDQVNKSNSKDFVFSEPTEAGVRNNQQYTYDSTHADSLPNEMHDESETTLEMNNSHDNPQLTQAVDDETECAAEELGEGIYVRSGDVLTLKEALNIVNGANKQLDWAMLDYDSETTSLSQQVSPRKSLNSLSTQQGGTGLVHFHLTQAGGFAVLQEDSPQSIVIEKAGKSARWGKNKSKLIQSGDTVIFKLVDKGTNLDDRESVKFLSVHRGWWLKWVPSAPTKNGYFTIHMKDTEATEGGDNPQGLQSSYLTFGASFHLQHKRWSKCLVGISAEVSATYGGRMLGLYLQPKNGDRSNLGAFPNQFDDGDVEMEQGVPSSDSLKSNWIRPLALQAYEVSCVPTIPFMTTTPGAIEKKEKKTLTDLFDSETNDGTKEQLQFAEGHHHMDVPAWIEIMNRTARVRQHTYVVRVLPPSQQYADGAVGLQTVNESFIRLRTGRDLALIMRAGMKWRNNLSSPRKSKQLKPTEYARSTSTSLIQLDNARVTGTLPTSPQSGNLRVRSLSTPNILELDHSPSVHSFDEIDTLLKKEDNPYTVDFLDLLEKTKNENDEVEAEFDGESSDGSDQGAVADENGNIIRKHGKGRKLLGKVAKAVKTTAASTGRTVVRKTTNTGKNVVLGTVNVGKSILPIRPKNPPLREPKSTKRHGSKQREKDLDLDVRSRSLKRIELMDAKISQRGLPFALAGELSAPEQSCYTVSNMVFRLSNEPLHVSIENGFSSLLAALVQTKSDQDTNFLKGGAVQLGVTHKKTYSNGKGSLLLDCLVARCLWESHWREEWCGIYETGVLFYAPLTQIPCLELQLTDIKSVRLLESGQSSPLPGYPLLVLETAWLCHYCAFPNDESRNLFYRAMEKSKLALESTDAIELPTTEELREAHFWQGFQNSVDFSLSLGHGKWAKIQSGAKMRGRVVLNNRRMTFDHSPMNIDHAPFVEDILQMSLQFSLTTLKENPTDLIRFLDAVSQFRSWSLSEIDMSSKSGFCIFVNIYHCLLQHALLLSIGPLNKRSWLHLMRTSCYEIGGDVFSLAELHCCVIRGNMSRSLTSKPPFMQAPKKASSYHMYALDYVNPCISFSLNTAEASCLRSVPVFKPSHLDEQLKSYTREFLQRFVVADATKKMVLLPKVFDTYKADFSTDDKGSAVACLYFALPYLSEETASIIRKYLFQDDLIIKFHPAQDHFHSRLEQFTVL